MADLERILLEFPEPHISFSPTSSPYSLKIRKSISWAAELGRFFPELWDRRALTINAQFCESY